MSTASTDNASTVQIEKLFRLLSSKKSILRFEATQALSTLLKRNNDLLSFVLVQSTQYLKSKNWNCRVFVADALGSIVSDVAGVFGSKTNDWNCKKIEVDAFNNDNEFDFALDSILSTNKLLYACESREFSKHGSSTAAGGTLATSQAINGTNRQRQQLDKHLGLNPNVGVTSKEWIADEDLSDDNSSQASSACSSPTRQSAGDQQQISLNAIDQMQSILISIQSITSIVDVLRAFCDYLLVALRHPVWECRHGAALAFREWILAAGRHHELGRVCNAQLARSMDAVLKQLLVILSIDRFNDFSSSQSVAPVRETSAQALVAVLRLRTDNERHTEMVKSAITQMLSYNDVGDEKQSNRKRTNNRRHSKPTCWEVKHAALVLLKYLQLSPSSRASFTSFLPSVMKQLGTDNDEIIAVALDVLIITMENSKHEQHTANLTPDLFTYAITLMTRYLDGGAVADSACLCNLLRLTDICIKQQHLHNNNHNTDSVVNLILPFLSNKSSLNVRQAALSCLGNLSIVFAKKSISLECVQSLLRALYRQLITESCENTQFVHSILRTTLEICDRLNQNMLAVTAMSCISAWLACLMVPNEAPVIDPVALQLEQQCICPDVATPETSSSKMLHLGGDEVLSLSSIDGRIQAVMQRKTVVAAMLVRLMQVIWTQDTDGASSLCACLRYHLTQRSANQQLAVALVLSKSTLARENPEFDEMVSATTACLLEAFNGVVFDESAIEMATLSRQCTQFTQKCRCYSGDNSSDTPLVTNTDTALNVCRQAYEAAATVANRKGNSSNPVWFSELTEQWQQLQQQIERIGPTLLAQARRVACFLAQTLIRWNRLPDKLNPVIRPLMDTIRFENVNEVVEATAASLAKLLRILAARTPISPACNKLLTNLTCALACDDQAKLRQSASDQNLQSISALYLKSKENAIPGAEPVLDTSTLIVTHNARLTLKKVVEEFGMDLETLSDLEQYLSLNDVSQTSTLNHRLQFIRATFGSVTDKFVSDWFLSLPQYLSHDDVFVRYQTGDLLVKIAAHNGQHCGLVEVLNHIWPHCHQCLTTATSTDQQRLGAIEFVHLLVDQLPDRLVPIACLLAPAVLSCMADQCDRVRVLAAAAFAQLVALLPLQIGQNVNVDRIGKTDHSNSNVETPPDSLNGLSDELRAMHANNSSFLTLLNNPSKLPMIDLSDIGLQHVTLRAYQKEGVTWLWFLNRYHLHGLLGDDMGLGKTLQTLCVMARSHRDLSQQQQQATRRSLIICPKTLIAHWVCEIQKYFGVSESRILRACAVERNTAMMLPNTANVVVTSYDTVRRESSFFNSHHWHYCVLDEGHVVRNHKSKLYQSIVALRSDYRLILTGTPVHNSVLDLWSLFQFLMPGYLGTLQSFTARYLKPVQQSTTDSNSDVEDQVVDYGSKDKSRATDVATKALNALHKQLNIKHFSNLHLEFQVLPFALRRLKSEVLDDLPPKIVQDYFCELTPTQRRLYEDISARMKHQLTTNDTEFKQQATKLSPLAVLTYLRKLCDHPTLVQQPISAQISADQFSQSGKFVALHELLVEAGIATDSESNNNNNNGDSTDQYDDRRLLHSNDRHRALIFCQFKAVCEMLAQCLAAGMFGSDVTFLRLDGSVPANQRQAIAQQFNNDTSIDVLLLTTQIGGLGLTLTGADMVIFVDHDWNPMTDLQAIDRAHRIGQRRTVNVYRLITRGTLEQKIMRIQKHKTDTAQVLIGADNRSLQSMGTDQLLDLLTLDDQTDAANGPLETSSKTHAQGDKMPPKKKKRRIDTASEATMVAEQTWNLSEIWDQSQEDEQQIDVREFAKKL